MKRISKKVLAAALVLTLAVPSAISLAADGEEPAKVYLPKALTKITMQKDSLDENGYTNVAGTEVVQDDKMGTVLHVSASTEEGGVYKDSEASFKNPLAGQDFKEIDVLQLNEVLQAQNEEKIANGEDPILDDKGNPIWRKGAVINYWIKLSGTDNGVVLNFRNKDRLQVHKDEYAKYIATKWATQAAEDEAANKEIDSRFALNNPQIYVDAEGTEYTVYSSIGQWGAYRPDFPKTNACTKASNGTIKARPKDDPNAEYVGLNLVQNQYDRYYETNHEKNPNSDARYTKADGYLQTSLDGGLDYKEDTYAGLEMNPNKTPEGQDPQPVDANLTNQLRWTGSSSIMSSLTEENDDTAAWHMVTVKFQNDSIDYYIDGELFEDLEEFKSWGASFTTTTQSTSVGKGFNGGWGWKAPYGYGIGNRKEWYGNMCGTLLMDWLSLDNTTFSIGGTNLERTHGLADAYELMADKDEHTERVADFCIDDIVFYGEVLTQEQIDKLYQNGIDKMAMEDPDAADSIPDETPTPEPSEPDDPDDPDKPTPEPVKGNGDVDGKDGATATDALEVLKYAAKIVTPTAEQKAAADTNLDGNVDATDALNILKLAARIIPSLPVEK